MAFTLPWKVPASTTSPIWSVPSDTGSLKDFEELADISEACRENSLCALGQTAANPINSTIRHFRDEYLAHIVDKACPAGVCKALISYHIDPEKCEKCSLCSRKCPVEAISGIPGRTPFEIDQSKCVRCGMCFSACRFGAVCKA